MKSVSLTHELTPAHLCGYRLRPETESEARERLAARYRERARVFATASREGVCATVSARNRNLAAQYETLAQQVQR